MINIYRYSLGINGIEEEIFEDVFVNSKEDRYIIEEMNDCGGDVLFEVPRVDEDKLSYHYGYGDGSKFLYYTEPKSNEYIKKVMYEEYRLQSINKRKMFEREIETIQYYQNLLRSDKYE